MEDYIINNDRETLDRINYKRSIRYWGDIGLLFDISEDRKPIMVDCYNYLLDRGSYERGETIPFVIIHCVVKEVDLTHNDIDKICDDVNETLIKRITDLQANFYPHLDCESEITSEYCKNKIDEIKKRSQLTGN